MTRWQWLIQQLCQPRSRPGAFNAFARRDLGPLLDRHGLMLPEPDLQAAQESVTGAMRHIIGVLFTSPTHRRRWGLTEAGFPGEHFLPVFASRP